MASFGIAGRASPVRGSASGASSGEPAPEARALAAEAPAREAAADPTAAVEALYRRHHAFVFALALRFGRGRKAWAEDVTQDVFVDLLRALPTLHDTDALEGWLYRATAHRCFKRLRRERFLELPAVRWLLGAPHEEPVHPEVAALARHDLSRAFAVVAELPLKERVAFCMFHLDGRSQDEIGEVLGHKKSYVCKLIQRATERLRELGWEVPDAAP